MSGQWRFCVAAFLLVGGLTTSAAFSNPLTDLLNPAPKEAEAPAPAKEACALQPGHSTAPGQHWFYRLDGHRKCWFQRAEAAASVKKPVYHHYVAKRPVIAPEEDKVALHKRTVLDARDQLLSAAPADAPRPAAPAPEAIGQASVAADEAAPPVPEVPIAAQPATDRLEPDHAMPRSVDVESLLAASSPDTVASSVPPAPARAPSIPDEDRWQLMATRAGVVLIALGLIFLIGSLASRFLHLGMAPVRRV